MAPKKTKIKLAHIVTVPRTFGFLHGHVAYMKAQGFDIHCISSPGDLLIKFGQQEHVPVYAVKMFRRITPVHDLFAVLKLCQTIYRISPVIVNTHTPKAGLLGMIAAFLMGVPVRVYNMRGLPCTTVTGGRRLLLQWTEMIACLLAHKVICVSHSIRQLVVSEGICPEKKIKVLVNGSGQGVDASNRFNPAHIGEEARKRIRKKYSIPVDAIVAGFVGRIVIDKGVLELAEAWRILRDEFPKFHLLVVGPFEPLDPIPAEVKDLFCRDSRIHLTGVLFDTPPLYAAMDILALPTYREGFSNVLLEAAAMELPVVATSVPGSIDAVEEDITGKIVQLGDPKALANALRLYLLDPELRRKHGVAGRERVLRDFRPEMIWEAQYQEYVSLMRKKGLVS